MSRRGFWFLVTIAAIFAVALAGWVFTDWYIFDGGLNPRYRK